MRAGPVGIAKRTLRVAAPAALIAALIAPAAGAALPAVTVDATTTSLADIGAHRGVAVSATCAGSTRLVGGGGYLRRLGDPLVLPTNGLVLGGTAASTGAAPVDLAAADGAADPASWLSIANFTGVSEAGDEASTFALCATSGGPPHTIVKAASRTGLVATQEVDPPNVATATCPAGSRLIGGGATTSTPDQVNDGVTVGNAGNLKPLEDYPSDAAGRPATDGSTGADSWSAFGSAGISSAADTATAYALCSTDPATPPVQIARVDVDGPDAQPGTTVTTASATCPAGTRMLGGGYRVDETVAGVGVGLAPQQGYHVRGSYPSTPGTPPIPAPDGASDPDSWTALVQAGGQNLAGGKHMTTHAYALCATPPAAPGSADLSISIADAPDPVTVGDTLTYTLTVANAGPSAATAVAVEQTLPASTAFGSASASAGSCTYAPATVSCALGTIAPGASATITVGVTVTAAVTLVSGASIASPVDDPDGSNNTATATTTALLAVRAKPALAGQAPATAPLGIAIGDTATLTGGASATGEIAFELYGPGDATCATPIASSVAAVSGDGSYHSAVYATTAPGTYRWLAGYEGDGANEPASSACADPAQAVSVKAEPALALQASGATTVGGSIGASATLSGGWILTGTITLRLYGPGDDGCASPLWTSTAPVSGNGIYSAPAYATGGAGTYRWTAQYGGDANNRAAGPSGCSDPAAAVSVTGTPALSAAAAAPPPAPISPAAADVSSRAFTIAAAHADARGRIRLTLRSPGAGHFTAGATAGSGRSSYRYGMGAATARRRATITLTIAPGGRARRDLRSRSVRVAVAVSFRPAGGTPRTRSRTLIVRRVR